MRFTRLLHSVLSVALLLGLVVSLPVLERAAISQETTGTLQGTVKDASGALIPGVKLTLTGSNLIGSKETTTDSAGYYRFANLPPGTYTLVASSKGFQTKKTAGFGIEVGHEPTLNVTLAVGQVETVVEVKGETAQIDVTATTSQTNLTEDVLNYVPHGTSFQSVIQFAPGARNEPLMGGSQISNGTGSVSPGNGSNGTSNGYSFSGASDSENSYLVEGQETANIIGGYSHTQVPTDFIQEVQLKSSGIEAEHGGALGGVVNVILARGTANYHGNIFSLLSYSPMDASPNPTLRYDPTSTGSTPSWGVIDPDAQLYQPVRPHYSDLRPGFLFGGPLLPFIKSSRDKYHFMVGANPEFNRYEVKLNYGSGGGIIPFSQNTNTYYSYGRIDGEVTKKIRLFGSWLYQLQRQNGESLPSPDSVQGYLNVATGCQGTGANFTCPGNAEPVTNFAHTLGYDAPNTTFNSGMDYTITSRIISTTRFGYYFENYHDFGYPTTGTTYNFAANGAAGFSTIGCDNVSATSGCTALSSNAPTLAQSTGYTSQAIDANFTHYNANKAIQLDQDLGLTLSSKGGTHNIKFGYQMNRLQNNILQGYSTPFVIVYPGVSNPYLPQGSVGAANCATIEAVTGYAPGGTPACVGTYGTVNVNDFGTGGTATTFNHAIFGQDSWNIGHGVTFNFGVRVEHEYLPAENQPSGSNPTPINFGWGNKVAPRLGFAWDIFKNGKLKLSGGYGEFYDQMKLNVAISSYGGQYWQECWYGLMQNSLSGLDPAYVGGRDCSGFSSSSTANWTGGTQPAGVTFLENQNLRAFPTTCSTCSIAEEGTAPGLKPYKQHETYLGVEYQIDPYTALEAHYDRRRIDHVIEDSAIFNPAVGETFVIVNPGQGVNSTFAGFYNFLYGTPMPACTSAALCPQTNTIPAARSYDGIEVILKRALKHHWAGNLSYTYSYFRGNYTGLTSSDVADGGGGRNAPNNSRAFDEPFFSWDAIGRSSSGLLPTDRPNALKGFAYYELGWLKKFTTDFGLFQVAYSGTPLTSYLDVGYAFPGAFPTDIVDRGHWIDVTQDPASGTITASAPYTKRTPAFTQTDLNLKQAYKITESKSLVFDVTVSNALNNHAVTSYGQQIDSGYATNFIAPQGYDLFSGPTFYGAAMHPYDYLGEMNQAITNGGGPLTINSQYGKPYLYQVGRNLRLGFHFNF